MSTLKNAGKPAQSPRAEKTEYVCTGTELAKSDCALLDCRTCPYYEKVSIEPDTPEIKCSLCGKVTWNWGENGCPDCGSIFCWDCYQSGASHYCEDLVADHSGLVTEPAGQVEAGVTKGAFAARDLTRCDHCGHKLLLDDEDYWYCPICSHPGEDDCISPPLFSWYSRFTSWDNIDREIHDLVSGAHVNTPWDIQDWRFNDDAEPFWHRELCTVPRDAFVEVRWGFINV